MLEHGMLKTPISSGSPSYSPVTDIFGDGSGVALYRLDGNANDESGNYHGTETAITYGGGQYERGAVFNGSTSKIDLGATIVNATGASYSIWIKASNIDNYVIYGGAVAGAMSLQLVNYPGDRLWVGIYSNLTYLYRDGNWHHYVITYAGATVKIYEDGVFKETLSRTVITPSTNILLGSNNGAQWYNGGIDQFRIFNRAITATEVTQLYAEVEPTGIIDNTNPFQDGSCKALYKFENNALDETGVYNGTATNVTYGTGKFGQCAVFNGSNSSVSVPSSIISSYLNGTKNWSISFWFSTTSIAIAYQYLFNFWNGSEVSLDIRSSGNLNVNTNASGGLLGVSLLPNTLYHMVLTYNATAIYFYLNGTKLNYTLPKSTIQSDSLGTNSIGIYKDLVNTPLSGSIDQFRIFNKALTPLEVASLYNETTPLENPMSHQVDPFKDGSGKALYRLEGNALDESGNYNGTASSITYGAGIAGRCAVFNDTTSVVSSEVVIPINMSVSMWINPTTLDATNRRLIKSGTTIAASSLDLMINSSNIIVRRGDGNVEATVINTPHGIATGSLRNIVITTNGSSTKLYVDNVLLINSSISIAIATYAYTEIGKFYNLTANTFNGLIDQVRVFTREITQAEVTSLYTNQA